MFLFFLRHISSPPVWWRRAERASSEQRASECEREHDERERERDISQHIRTVGGLVFGARVCGCCCWASLLPCCLYIQSSSAAAACFLLLAWCAPPPPPKTNNTTNQPTSQQHIAKQRHTPTPQSLSIKTHTHNTRPLGFFFSFLQAVSG